MALQACKSESQRISIFGGMALRTGPNLPGVRFFVFLILTVPGCEMLQIVPEKYN
jgi:hypothetical protein